MILRKMLFGEMKIQILQGMIKNTEEKGYEDWKPEIYEPFFLPTTSICYYISNFI